jgi:hypothetical protein
LPGDYLFIFDGGIRKESFRVMLISHDLPTEMFDTHTHTFKKTKNNQNNQKVENIQELIES